MEKLEEKKIENAKTGQKGGLFALSSEVLQQPDANIS